MSFPVDRWQWQQSIASEQGPRGGKLRMVLMALSLHMKADGTGAWPSQALLSKRADVGRRTVQRALESAERNGWLVRQQSKRSGQAWRLTEYEATVPDAVAETLTERPWEDPQWQRGATVTPPSEKRGANGAQKVAPNEQKVAPPEHKGGAKLWRTNSSLTLQETNPKREGSALKRTTPTDASLSEKPRRRKTKTVRQGDEAVPIDGIETGRRSAVIELLGKGFSIETVRRATALTNEEIRQVVQEHESSRVVA